MYVYLPFLERLTDENITQLQLLSNESISLTSHKITDIQLHTATVYSGQHINLTLTVKFIWSNFNYITMWQGSSFIVKFWHME